MQIIQFEVTKSYILPSILVGLSAENNQVIFDAIATVLTHGNSLSSNELRDNFATQMKRETDREVTAVKAELSIRLEEIKQIKEKNDLLTADALRQLNTVHERHAEEIAKVNEKRTAEIIELQAKIKETNHQRELMKATLEHTRQLEKNQIEHAVNDALLKQQLAEKTLIAKYTAEISMINERKAADTIELQAKLNESKANIANLQLTLQKKHTAEIAEYTKLLGEKSKEINALHANHAADIQRLSESETNKRLEAMNNQLAPMYEFYNGSNNDKGTLGEFTVKKILEDARFSGALIQDVSSTAEDSDIYFCFSNLKCLIEVKNKKIITRGDVTKFERDVAKNVASGKINCALFVSLVSNKLADINISNIYTKVLNNIQLVHVHLTSPNELFLAIAYLQSAVDLQTDVTDEDIDTLKVHFNNYATFTDGTLVHLTKQRKIFTLLLKEIEDRIRLVQGNQDKIAADATRYMIDNETIVSNENRTPEYYAQILAAYALDAKNTPLLNEEHLQKLLATSTTVNFPAIIEIASTLVLKHCIKGKSVNLINADYIANNKYPSGISKLGDTYGFLKTTERLHKKLRYKEGDDLLPPIDDAIIAYVKSYIQPCETDNDQ